MTISVLMSVYKNETPSFLEAALKSVWTDQTLKPDCIILVKDGPLPEELDAVADKWSMELKDKMIICQNPKNVGLTKSLNIGLKQVKTDLIARMDSDDISDPLRFERQVRFLQENPDIDVVGGALQEFNEGHPNLNVRHYPLTPEQSRRYIVKASPLAHPTVMIRRRVFDDGVMYDERFRVSQDIALWFDLLARGYKIANLPEVTIYFRRDDAVFKRRNRSRALIEFKIFMNGIYRLYGLFTFSYIYPLARLVFRLMPTSVIKWIYGSSLRNRVLQK